MTKEITKGKMNTWAGLDFVPIPKGKFIMGSKESDEFAWGDEKPQHTLEIPYEYWAGKYPVRVDAFCKFVKSTGFITRAEVEGWCWVWNVVEKKWVKTEGANWAHPLGESKGIETDKDSPVVQVCWYDARAFCEWLNQNHEQELPKGYQFRLPSEAEWEKAARGPNGSLWPWGNMFDPGLCNSRESGGMHTVKTGKFPPEGNSEYGVADMSGNIWEWTVTLWGEDKKTPAFVYPYLNHDGRENLGVGEEFYRVIRGGSFKDDLRGVRCACRDIDPPHYSLNNLGFRVFVTPSMR